MSENVITVSFAENSSAYEAFTNLKELWRQGQVFVRSAAIVERDESGHMTIKDQVEDPDLTGPTYWGPGGPATVTGGLIGLVVAILGGSLGVLFGGATGLLNDSLFDLDDQPDEGSALEAISSTVRPGQTVVLAHVSEQSEEFVDGAMARLGGRVLRRSVNEVKAEIAAADEALRAATRAARKKLHAERRDQRSEEIHEKVEALKAKQRELQAAKKRKLEALHAQL